MTKKRIKKVDDNESQINKIIYTLNQQILKIKLIDLPKKDKSIKKREKIIKSLNKLK